MSNGRNSKKRYSIPEGVSITSMPSRAHIRYPNGKLPDNGYPGHITCRKDDIVVILTKMWQSQYNDLISHGALIGELEIYDFDFGQLNIKFDNPQWPVVLYDVKQAVNDVTRHMKHMGSEQILDNFGSMLEQAFQPCKEHTDRVREMNGMPKFSASLNDVYVSEGMIPPPMGYTLGPKFLPPTDNFPGRGVYISDGIRIELYNIQESKTLDGLLFGHVKIHCLNNGRKFSTDFASELESVPLYDPIETLKCMLPGVSDEDFVKYVAKWARPLDNALEPCRNYSNENGPASFHGMSTKEKLHLGNNGGAAPYIIDLETPTDNGLQGLPSGYFAPWGEDGSVLVEQPDEDEKLVFKPIDKKLLN